MEYWSIVKTGKIKLNSIMFTKLYYSNHPDSFNGTHSFTEQNDPRNF
jgi:hypothetical protein